MPCLERSAGIGGAIILAAIIVAFVMHPALGLTLAAGGVILGVTWLVSALLWAATKVLFRWLGSLVGIDLSRTPKPVDPAILARAHRQARFGLVGRLWRLRHDGSVARRGGSRTARCLRQARL